MTTSEAAVLTADRHDDGHGRRERAVPDRPEPRWGTLLRWGVVAVAAAVLVAVLAWRSGEAPEPVRAETDVPVIRAGDEPVKVRPESAGGLEIADRDKFIYRRLREGGEPPPVERLLPKPEEPVPPPASAKPAPRAAATPATPQPPGTASAEAEKGSAAPPVDAPAPPVPMATAAGPGRPAGQVPTKAEPAPNASGGSYAVQIGAVRTQDQAKAEWERLRRRHGDILGTLRLDVARADLGDKGVFYRLRAGPLPAEDKAKSLCAVLANRRVSCAVVRSGG
jgi:cell division septation protein DedD